MKVLIVEPPNQQMGFDTARVNGSLGPAYLIGALREHGIEADYYDGTVGWPEDAPETTYYNRTVQPNGMIRCGAAVERLTEVLAGYSLIATSSIFTAQTRMHFELAAIAGRLGIPIISGGVNARALASHFKQAGFQAIAPGDGEAFIVQAAGGHAAYPAMNDLPRPALDALPLKAYWDLGVPHAGVLPKGTRFAAIQTSRGCQDRCTFCHISVEKQQGAGFLRVFSDERIHQYVDDAVQLGVERLYFEDDNLFFNKNRLRRLAPVLKREGLEYSNVNGANLRFLFDAGHVDEDFIGVLAGFGLKELVLPFESRSRSIMQTYATGKYDPDLLDSAALVGALKAAGIRCAGNFMIGFRDEPLESVLATIRYAGELRAAGLDAVGFMIPVPYPGSVDFQHLSAQERFAFDTNVLSYTDQMHWHAKPLFSTRVPGEQLAEMAIEAWVSLNSPEYRSYKTEGNIQ